MNLQERQAKEYLEEAFLTLESAKAILIGRKGKPLWAQIIKSCYDSMEQAISAAIAKKDGLIPKEHPQKVMEFIKLYGKTEVSSLILKWLRKRSRTQYVDIKDEKIIVPHEMFTEEDALSALKDSEKVINFIKELIYSNK